jgi:hypothetical protein
MPFLSIHITFHLARTSPAKNVGLESMLLSDIETAVRQDLFDPLGNTNQRWQTSDIDRAIDKAVDRYSALAPNIAYADMNTAAYQRTYPYPASWDAAYPVMWLERILYPLQVYGSSFLPPAAPSLATAAGAGLSVGLYQYAVTLLTEGGETTPSPAAFVTTTNGNQQVRLSNIQTGGTLPGNSSAGATNTVIGRNLYRTQAGGSSLSLLATLPDATTTTYTDSTPDSSLANMPSPPTVNTSGTMLWPPRERQFSEFSGLFDGSIALSGGGNLGSAGAPGRATSATGAASPTFTLHLLTSELPKDNTLVMRVFYATKHQLDNFGSTIPEIHRDVIVLGATAYAMEAYQTPTNDNFEYQDGALRDRVDDTKIPLAWLEAIKQRLARFDARLQEIKQARDFAASARAQWGNVPVRWNWL